MRQGKALKVMQVVSGDLWGGAEAQVFTLCRCLLMNQQVDLFVLILNNGVLKDRLEQLGVTVYLCDERELGAGALVSKMRQLLLRVRPDVIHTHGPKQNSLASIANFFSVNATCVRTQHSEPEFSFGFSQHVQFWLDWFCGRFLQQRIISVSEELAIKLSARYPRSRITVIENGVDLDSISSRLKAAPFKNDQSKAVHIGLIGRLVPVKRVDLFIEMAAYCLRSDEVAEMELVFHIMGDGGLREELERQAEQLGVSSRNLVFHGHVNDIEHYMRSLDLLVMCSDHEGLPMTLLEAMALGVPAVGHNVGALRAYFERGEGGVLSEGHSSESYAKTVINCLKNDLSTVILRGQHLVQREFSAKRNAKRILSEYDRVRS